MIIVHKCQACGHGDLADGQSNRYDDNVLWPRTNCGSPAGVRCCKQCQWGPPQLARSWDGVTLQPETLVHKPGSTLADDVRLCGCADCEALYRAQPADVRGRPKVAA